MRVEPADVLGYAEDLSQWLFFRRNTSKMEGATRKNDLHEPLLRGKEAHLASSSLTLSLTKQALRALPFCRGGKRVVTV